jgi:hypothetical protein
MNNFDKFVRNIKEKKKGFFLDKFSVILEGYWEKLSKGIFQVEVKNAEELFPKIDLSSLKIPTSFKINNPEDIAEYIVIPKVEIPKSIKIDNLSELSKYFEVKEVVFPKEFSIKNLGDIPKTNIPSNLKKLSLDKSEKLLTKLIKEVVLLNKNNTVDEVFIKNKKLEEYIPVRIVNKDGKDWLESFGGGGMYAPSVVGIKNISNETINPATEEGIQDVVTAIGNQSFDGLATEEKQAEFSIPDFDEQVIDESNPNEVTITYKKSAVTVAVKTISVTGNITTITVV